jgi:hypothetical protein
VGEDKLGAGILQAPHQLDGVLDALAGHDPRRLEDEHIVVGQSPISRRRSRL